MAVNTLFTWGPANVDTLLATTLSVFTDKELNDNIFRGIPTWEYLNKKNRVTKSGGASLLVRLLYQKNSTAQFYSGFDILDTTPQEGQTAAQFKWGRAAASVSISGQEQDQNSGEAEVADLMGDKVEQAMMSLADLLAIQAYSSSTNSKAILNLPNFIDASSTIGDVNSGSNSWWQAQVKASGSFAAQGRADWTNVYNTLSIQGRRASPPDFGVTTQTVFEAYESSLVPQMRYTDNKMGDSGFENLKFKGMTLMFDPNVPSGECYFLSSDALKLVVHSKRNFTRTPMVKPSNQDALTGQIIWMGQLVTNNRRKLAKFTGMTA